MGLGDILSRSISYPFSDLKKFLMVGICLLIIDLDAILSQIVGQNSFVVIIAFIIAVLFSFVVAGYSVSVTKRGIDNSMEIPDFDYKNNFIDGVKLFVVGLVYFIIPVIITLILLFLFGAVGSHFGRITESLGIGAIFVVILFIVFGIFAVVAQARYAVSRSIGDAISIGEVFDDVKRIGILKIILFLIITFVVVSVLALILGVITVIPVIGTIIVDILLGGFIFLFISYAMGLLYSE